VVVNYVKGQEAARRLADDIVSKGGKAEVAGFDVADTKAVDAAVGEILERHGKVDVLVANAGAAGEGLMWRSTDEDLDRLWATNVRGATPTTVNGWPLSEMGRPTTAGSAANRRCHNLSLSTATPGLPGTSSEGTNSRPTVACTPSVTK
jgi:NAD(P)-dependent dehydrogenase (short-subunit alcohol dehydrogenase family)